MKKTGIDTITRAHEPLVVFGDSLEAQAMTFAMDAVPCPAVIVVDGDTLRCGKDRLRLLGIDAPELHKCPPQRRGQCVSGSGPAARETLRQALSHGAVRYQVITHDRYGRLVVLAWAGGVNLSCWQLRQGQAVYKPKWDNGRRVARECSIK